jgi:hypothetical protein
MKIKHYRPGGLVQRNSVLFNVSPKLSLLKLKGKLFLSIMFEMVGGNDE